MALLTVWNDKEPDLLPAHECAANISAEIRAAQLQARESTLKELRENVSGWLLFDDFKLRAYCDVRRWKLNTG